MKAFVTGASGFTGSHLVKALEKKGWQVSGLVRETSALDRLAGTNADLVRGDICDRDALSRGMEGADFAFHVAAYVDLGLVDETQMERSNLEGTRTVLECARAANLRKLVYCSSISIYGDTQGQTIDETFRRAQQSYDSAYDRTKTEAQKLVDRAAAEGLPVVSIMPSGILGADDPHFGPVLRNFLKGVLRVWAGGDRITGVVCVEDLVELMVSAAENAEPGAHYIASAGDLPTREMFEILGRAGDLPAPKEIPEPIVRLVANLLDPIGRLLSWNPPIGRERVRYIYDRCVRVDASKARRELGWQPRSPERLLQEIAHEILAELPPRK